MSQSCCSNGIRPASLTYRIILKTGASALFSGKRTFKQDLAQQREDTAYSPRFRYAKTQWYLRGDEATQIRDRTARSPSCYAVISCAASMRGTSRHVAAFEWYTTLVELKKENESRTVRCPEGNVPTGFFFQILEEAGAAESWNGSEVIWRFDLPTTLL